MKRVDTFMLGMSAFIFANCISYFVLSRAPYVTGWGYRPGWHDILEEIGVPFVSYSLANGFLSCPWINWIANFIVATTISLLFATLLADHLPLLWVGHSRDFRYSLLGLLIVVTIIGIILGIGMKYKVWGFAVRNLICFGGPYGIYAWYLYRRRLSWTWLTIAGIGLILMVLTIDFRYQQFFNMNEIVKVILYCVPPDEHADVADWTEYAAGCRTMCFVTLMIIRTVVPIFGSLSLLVIIHAAYDIVRRCSFGRE
jgi:hypothetical protein